MYEMKYRKGFHRIPLVSKNNNEPFITVLNYNVPKEHHLKNIILSPPTPSPIKKTSEHFNPLPTYTHQNTPSITIHPSKNLLHRSSTRTISIIFPRNTARPTRTHTSKRPMHMYENALGRVYLRINARKRARSAHRGDYRSAPLSPLRKLLFDELSLSWGGCLSVYPHVYSKIRRADGFA